MFDKIKYFYECMQAGKSLQNPRLWSQRASLIAALTALLTAGVGLARALGYDVDATGTDIAAVAQGLGVLGVIVVDVIHRASNKEAGKR